MAAIGKISVLVSANISEFRKGMDKVSKRTAGLRGGMSKLAKVGAVAFAAMGAAALGAAAALLKIVNANALVIDQIAKFSDEIGSTTEQLAGYRLGAELTGVSTESLDKGLQKLVRRLGEAQMGYGEGVKGFEALGIAASELEGIAVDDALRRVADAIQDTENPAQKAAAAYALFGRQGQELLTFLNQGSEGIDAFVAEAEALGSTFSREEAAKVEAYNDAITRLKTFLKGVSQTLTIAVVPYFTAFVNTLTESGKEGFSASQLISKGLSYVGAAIGFLADVWELVKAAFYGFRAAIFKGIEEIIVGPIALLAQAIDTVLEALGQEPTGAAEFLNIFKDELGNIAGESAAQAEEAFNNFVNGVASSRVAETFEQIENEAAAAAREIAANAAAQADVNAQVAEAQALFEEYAKAQEEIGDVIATAERALFEFGKTQEEITLARLNELNATEEQIASYRRAAQELARLEAAEDAAEDARKAAEDAAKDREKQRERLSGDRDKLLEQVGERATAQVEVRFAEAIKLDSAESGRLAQLRAAEERRFREEARNEREQLALLNRQIDALDQIAANTGGEGGTVALVGID